MIEMFTKEGPIRKPQVQPSPVSGIVIDDNEIKQRQLVEILKMLGNSEEILDFVATKILQNGTSRFKTIGGIKQWIGSLADQNPLAVSKFIESSVGRGTMRTLSFMGTDPQAPKDILKILEGKFAEESFGKKVERGMYMVIMESYDVKWSFEKVARDIWQNFFDANGQTLDGIKSKITPKIGTYVIRIEGPQDYDWRELVHIGATNKVDSERSAGGFGEGAKILAFVLLRDHSVKKIKFASRDWEIQYYLADVPKESYNKEVRGLYVKKTRHPPVKGNFIEVVFDMFTAPISFGNLERARDLFYSQKNADFQKPHFNDPDRGGFKILPPQSYYPHATKGHLYIAGQRINYESRDKWETVEGVNIWIWRKVLTIDRDRGLVTKGEMENRIIPSVVGAMKRDDQTKAVYDFKPYWDKGDMDDVAYMLQEKIVEALAAQSVQLKFEPDYLSCDIPYFSKNRWIVEALSQQGYKICHSFLAKVGMKKVTERFRELHEHFRLEATPSERHRIDLLQKAAREIGIDSADIKEVWIFGMENEKSIFSGQYTDMFYWMARETLRGNFFDALHTYVHEVAHKSGTHGTSQFEYELQQQIKKIQLFMSEKRGRYQRLENEWNRLDFLPKIG